MRARILAIPGLLISLASPAQQDRTSLVQLPAGALVLTVSSEYGGSWNRLGLLDGSTASGWCSAEGAKFPHTVVVELPQESALTSVAVDNTGDQEAGYQGISAKHVEILASLTSADAGYTPVVALDAAKGGRREVALPKAVNARWLKFVVTSNWGNPDYTEIMELEAYGRPVGPAPKVDVAGVYNTSYGLMRIEQDGARLAGCYGSSGGQLSGNLNGRVMELEWREDEGKRIGTAVMVAADDGGTLNGVWFENGALHGEWSGERAAPGQQPECAIVRGGGLTARLAEGGRAVLYGVYFDSDSATLKSESEPTLEEVAAVLTSEPDLKLLVGGYTDATNTDAYNLQLSQKRAEAVVAWLVAHGVAAPRLSAKGFGKAQPVADNKTAAGRALNRRVELVVQK
ncbi:MAG: OmpA family protein [Acidobacteriota bacterium]